MEKTLLDINAEKIKSEKEAMQLREQLERKNKEVEQVMQELVKLRKRNETLERMVADLQNKLESKSEECISFDITM